MARWVDPPYSPPRVVDFAQAYAQAQPQAQAHPLEVVQIAAPAGAPAPAPIIVSPQITITMIPTASGHILTESCDLPPAWVPDAVAESDVPKDTKDPPLPVPDTKEKPPPLPDLPPSLVAQFPAVQVPDKVSEQKQTDVVGHDREEWEGRVNADAERVKFVFGVNDRGVKLPANGCIGEVGRLGFRLTGGVNMPINEDLSIPAHYAIPQRQSIVIQFPPKTVAAALEVQQSFNDRSEVRFRYTVRIAGQEPGKETTVKAPVAPSKNRRLVVLTWRSCLPETHLNLITLEAPWTELLLVSLVAVVLSD